MATYTGKKLSFAHNGDTFILDPVSVFEYSDVEHFPAVGQSGKVYIALDKNAIFRWDDTDQEYIPISSSGDANIASEYSSSSTYLADDVVLYDDLLYRANADISTAEEWTPAHWTATTVAAELIRRIHTMTGASSSTAGEEGYVPAPSAGDQDKVLTGDGTWKESPGAKVYVKTVTITNTSGAYSQTFVDENISASMKAVEIEVNRSYVFGDSIIVTPNDGSVTVDCADVAGTDTIKISLIKTIDDPTAVTSTEFTILNNRLLAVENVCTDTDIVIETTDWELNSGVYEYTWESSIINSACSVEVMLRDGSESAGLEGFEFEKATGGVKFTADIPATGDLPLTVRVINAKADAFQELEASDISTEAVTGADNVEEALTAIVEDVSDNATAIAGNTQAIANVASYESKGNFNNDSSLQTILTTVLSGMGTDSTKLIRLNCNGSFGVFGNGLIYAVDVKKYTDTYAAFLFQTVGYAITIAGSKNNNTWTWQQLASQPTVLKNQTISVSKNSSATINIPTGYTMVFAVIDHGNQTTATLSAATNYTTNKVVFMNTSTSFDQTVTYSLVCIP